MKKPWSKPKVMLTWLTFCAALGDVAWTIGSWGHISQTALGVAVGIHAFVLAVVGAIAIDIGYAK